MKWNRGVTLIETLVVLAIVAILAVLVVGNSGRGGCANISHGEGQKIGQIVTLNKQGLYYKTWEGQLIRGGMSDGSGVIGMEPFNFTVESDELVEQVQHYMRDQTEVVITYVIEGVYSPCRSESAGNFLIAVEPAEAE